MILREKINFDSWRSCHALLDLNILELAHARFSWQGRNSYSFNRCFIILEGEGKIYNHTAGQSLKMRPDRIYFMPPSLDLSFDFQPGLCLISIHFNAFILPGIDVFSGRSECLSFAAEKRWTSEFSGVLGHEPEWTSFCRFESLLWELLSHLYYPEIEQLQVISELHGRYGKLLQYIHHNINARTGIAELCAVTQLGRDTLSRGFSRDFGIPLKTFLMNKLISTAERYLLHTDLSIREISEKMQFSSEFYFSSFFKRIKGIPPTEFRAMREKI